MKTWITQWSKYLFAEPFTLRALWCRLRKHPCGVEWYTMHGLEPDMTCKNCGDDLG